MSSITAARYTEPDNSQVVVEPHGWTMPQPCDTWHQTELDLWIAEGNTIAPYDTNHGVTDEQLREQAYQDNAEHLDKVILAAESNPIQGSFLDDRSTKKENDRRVNRAKGKTKLTDADDDLADYIDTCMNALDNADDSVENLNRQQLIDWDATAWAYPVWTPPIG